MTYRKFFLLAFLFFSIDSYSQTKKVSTADKSKADRAMTLIFELQTTENLKPNAREKKLKDLNDLIDKIQDPVVRADVAKAKGEFLTPSGRPKQAGRPTASDKPEQADMRKVSGCNAAVKRLAL